MMCARPWTLSLLALVAAAAAGVGCAGAKVREPLRLPEFRESPRAGVHAGVAEVDITPPPGVSAWAGYTATGWRGRLACKALAVENAAPILWVTCDLAEVTPPLRAAIFDRLRAAGLPLERVRLLITATGATGSPRGHASAHWDLGVRDWLADRAAAALIGAWLGRVPAELRENFREIEGLGRVALVRVDRASDGLQAGRDQLPMGVWLAGPFPIGPAPADVFDGGLPTVVARTLERGLDQRWWLACARAAETATTAASAPHRSLAAPASARGVTIARSADDVPKELRGAVARCGGPSHTVIAVNQSADGTAPSALPAALAGDLRQLVGETRLVAANGVEGLPGKLDCVASRGCAEPVAAAAGQAVVPDASADELPRTDEVVPEIFNGRLTVEHNATGAIARWVGPGPGFVGSYHRLHAEIRLCNGATCDAKLADDWSDEMAIRYVGDRGGGRHSWSAEWRPRTAPCGQLIWVIQGHERLQSQRMTFDACSAP